MTDNGPLRWQLQPATSAVMSQSMDSTSEVCVEQRGGRGGEKKEPTACKVTELKIARATWGCHEKPGLIFTGQKGALRPSLCFLARKAPFEFPGRKH